MKSKQIIFVLLLLVMACSKDDEATPSPFSDYIDRFADEAKTREYPIDLSNLSMDFVQETDPPGYCGYGTINPPRVQIRQSDNCWNDRTDSEKEILVFHELGHAVLNRAHTNDTLPNGDFKSMMFNGNQFNIYTKHTPEKRQYYLDELFNPSARPPSWSNPKTQRIVLLTDSIAVPNNWSYVNTAEPEDKGTIADNFFSSKGHSLSITSAATLSNGFSYWWYRVPASGIPVGSKLMLKVKIKSTNVTGTGAYFTLRGDAKTEENFFVASYVVSGSQEFNEYSLKLNYYPADVNNLSVFLILDGTSTGTVYFDDITLLNYR